MTRVWTDEQLAIAEDEWKNGTANARAIASRLGVTRNAVLGVVHRRKWHRAKPAPPVVLTAADKPGDELPAGKPGRPHHRRPPARSPKAIRSKDGISLLALTARTCHWPVTGEGAMTLFCGARVDDGQVYCAEHALRARGQRM